MHTVKINNKEFNIEFFDNEFIHGKINGLEFKLDILKNDDSYNIIHNYKSYNIHILEIDQTENKIKLKINNQTVEASVISELDKIVKSMGFKKHTAEKNKNLKAPMPGLVTNIPVSKGDQIKKGDNLIVLEAMKMENNLKAENDSIIKDIIVKKGSSVEKNEVLIIFE